MGGGGSPSSRTQPVSCVSWPFTQPADQPPLQACRQLLACQQLPSTSRSASRLSGQPPSSLSASLWVSQLLLPSQSARCPAGQLDKTTCDKERPPGVSAASAAGLKQLVPTYKCSRAHACRSSPGLSRHVTPSHIKRVATDIDDLCRQPDR